MQDDPSGAGARSGPDEGLSDAEKLVALDTYVKVLKGAVEKLRAAVTADLGALKVERVGAYLPSGEKIGTVGYQGGNVTAKVTDPDAALSWCRREHPEEIVESINPAFLKAVMDWSKKVGRVGDHGVDPVTGERLDFITLTQGDPFVRVETTEEGVERMTALAGGFAGMLEATAHTATEGKR